MPTTQANLRTSGPRPCSGPSTTAATEDFASIAAGDGLGGVLMFHKVPEDKTVKNRVHFDLQASDVAAEADRLMSLGAKQIRSLAENNNLWISFTDPEGNEFDLVAGRP